MEYAFISSMCEKQLLSCMFQLCYYLKNSKNIFQEHFCLEN